MSSPTITPTMAAAAIGLALLATRLVVSYLRPRTRYGPNPPLPPGPKPLPLIGNVRDLPPPESQSWQFWLAHKDKYGPISSVQAFGMVIVIVHDPAIVSELFEKRGAKYSSRPWFTFSSDMCGYGGGTVMLPYGPDNRAHRKYMHSMIGTKAALARYEDVQMTEVRRFLLRVMEQPDELFKHITAEAGTLIVKMAYGYTPEPHSPDPLLELVRLSMHQFAEATRTGQWMVDLLPWLKYVPDFFPGTGFKQTAREYRDVTTRMTNAAFEFTRSQMATGNHIPSYVSSLWERIAAGDNTVSAADEEHVKWSAMALYGGGADTTVNAIHFFFLNIMAHPEIQRRAQAELDSVVGPNRLPTFADRPNLPYINAIVSETFRWHPVVPMGAPHVVTDDDVYDGYLIPKGTLILPNVWWFTHDPKIYPEPMEFNPDRWLGEQAPPDPQGFIFGFGRRICPGKVMADQNVFLMLACTLAMFDIAKPVDPVTKKPIEPEVDFVDAGISSLRNEFKVDIKPRSAEHAELIKSVEVDRPWEEGSSRLLGKEWL